MQMQPQKSSEQKKQRRGSKMMEFEEFCDYMKDHILEHFPEEYQDRTVRIDHYKVEGEKRLCWSFLSRAIGSSRL